MTILLLILLSTFLNQVSSSPSNESIAFNFPSFNAESCRTGSLICRGAVTAYDGYLSLTSEPLPASNSTALPLDEVGRVLYHQPVLAWPASITTVFTIKISEYPNSPGSGDGMAFLFAPDDQPPSAISYGSYLGIMDKFTEASGNVEQLAVELDTYKNDFDPDGNHVGIDTTSVREPVVAMSLNSTGVDLKSGGEITVRIDYDGWMKSLNVYVSYSGSPLQNILRQQINMSDIVPTSVYVGFSAATGAFSESHQLLNWAFITKPLPSYSLTK